MVSLPHFKPNWIGLSLKWKSEGVMVESIMLFILNSRQLSDVNVNNVIYIAQNHEASLLRFVCWMVATKQIRLQRLSEAVAGERRVTKTPDTSSEFQTVGPATEKRNRNSYASSPSSIYLPQIKTFIIITEYIWWHVARKTKRSSSWRPIINNSINYQ